MYNPEIENKTQHSSDSEFLTELTLKDTYPCRICGKIFDTLEEYEDHCKSHNLPIFQPTVDMAL
ncbi:MAG: hypothetical protein FWG55_05220 [Candidatus Bathyarchaeota archaeon]|nr:hypothetical protein [Candidatus Termiticorpusculum sp.]